MANERLRDALRSKGFAPVDIAAKLEVDIKTVERWITKSRVPQSRHRYALTALLNQTENYLWPDALKGDRKILVSESELIHTFPRRKGVPAELWRRLFEGASQTVDVLAYGGLF